MKKQGTLAGLVAWLGGQGSARANTPAGVGFRSVMGKAAGITRRILGVPDYDRYLAHVQERHPGTTPMNRVEFERARLEDRYSRPGQRCC